MRLFSARLDIESFEDLGSGAYQIEANIVDNTAMYFAFDVVPGDIIYVSGLNYGYDLFRYQVTEIVSSVGTRLIAKIAWDMPYAEFDPLEPFGDAIIGARHLGSMTANIVDTTVNEANEKLVADARNYQQILTNVNIMTNSSSTPDKAFVYEQEQAEMEWTINHEMDKHPSVSIVDEEGRLLIGDVQYIDSNTVILTFSVPFAGKAYLN